VPLNHDSALIAITIKAAALEIHSFAALQLEREALLNIPGSNAALQKGVRPLDHARRSRGE